MGVGEEGWGLCTYRCQTLHNKEIGVEYGAGADLAHGDRVGVLLDMDRGKLSYYLNGEPFGPAFQGLKGELFPALDFSQTGTARYKLNFDAALLD
jgi:hypothetical protein